MATSIEMNNSLSLLLACYCSSRSNFIKVPSLIWQYNPTSVWKQVGYIERIFVFLELGFCFYKNVRFFLTSRQRPRDTNVKSRNHSCIFFFPNCLRFHFSGGVGGGWGRVWAGDWEGNLISTHIWALTSGPQEGKECFSKDVVARARERKIPLAAGRFLSWMDCSE